MRVRNVRKKQAARYLRRMPMSYAYKVPWSVVYRIQGDSPAREKRRSGELWGLMRYLVAMKKAEGDDS